MAVNERALSHYNNACHWLQQAVEAESVNDAIKFTGFTDASIKLAIFCVENHALVAGVDEAQPLSQMTQFPPGYGGPRPWGGAPAVPTYAGLHQQYVSPPPPPQPGG